MENFVETVDMEKVWTLFAANKKKTFVAVLVPPAVRVCIGEKFGLARGEDAIGKVAAVLRVLGADAVVDTAIANDVVTLAQAKAVKYNKENGGGVVFSTACPAWVEYAAENYPALLEGGVAPAMEICARLVKKLYREQNPAKSVRVIAVSPCSKKREIGGADVVLTMDELTEILKSTEVNLRLVKAEGLDAPLGACSGAAYLPAASGGEAEALARCLNDNKEDFERRKLIYSGLYHGDEPRIAEVEMNGGVYKLAVASSLDAAAEIVRRVNEGESFDFVEVTARVGGQIGNVDGVEDADRTLKLRGLGLRYLDQVLAARSADCTPAAEYALKTWEGMLRSGEATEENEDFALVEVEEPAPVVEEVAEVVEEVVEEPTPVVEEVAAAVTPVEETVEETVEEPVVEVVEEPAPVVVPAAKGKKSKKEEQEEMDNIIDRWDELDEKTKSLYYRRFSMRERKRLARKNRSKK